MPFCFSARDAVGAHIIIEQEEEEAIQHALGSVRPNTDEEAGDAVSVVDFLCCVQQAIVMVDCGIGVVFPTGAV